ncbi:MAG: AraC family transcriptional regulator [Bacillota bacterium]|jgi:AraC family transcriptional regulator
MKSHFGTFIENIPPDIHIETKSYISPYLAIFEPQKYVMGDRMCFEDYHFVIFLSNSPLAAINGSRCQFKKGNFIAIPPGTIVSVLSSENIKLGKYIAISVKKDFFERIASEAIGTSEYKIGNKEYAYSKDLFDLIGSFQRELMDYGESYPLMLESISTQIVFQLIRDMNIDSSAKRNKLNKENKYIIKAIEFMQNYYSSNITINDICSMIYLSPCHFKRLFKEYTGRTPYQYLMFIRIERAKEILSEERYSIEEVARMCGFVNSGHFSTAFKRIVGMSPSEYRKIAK